METTEHLCTLVANAGFSSQKQARYRLFCERFLPQLSDELRTTLTTDAATAQSFVSATLNSEFLQGQLEKFPHWYNELVDTPLSRQAYEQAWAQSGHSFSCLQDFNKALRQFRNQSMCGIIWRDFNRHADTLTTTQELTWLAEICVQAAVNFHYPLLREKHGAPCNRDHEEQPLLVLGMGKLGAGELNLSSDIDLIFAYPETGDTHGRKPVSNQEFFIFLGKALIQSLDTVTADGFVFRVDMRLRPFGESGALVSHFDALENYYQTQGREWERYAMIKARVIASSLPGEARTQLAITELYQLLSSFTYRKYVDFSVVEALRKLKQMISQEVARRKLGDDVKLGAGGIREIEFIAQAFQLIRGGRDIQLQDNRLLTVLPLLEDLRCLPEGMATQLTNAYCFLRDTEHAIQGFQDKQTQKLPSDPDQQRGIAQLMGYQDWPAFYDALNAHRNTVKAEFAAVIATPENKQSNAPVDGLWADVWHNALSEDSLLKALADVGYEDPKRTLSAIAELRECHPVAALQPVGRERLDNFMPRLLETLGESPAPSATLERVLQLVRAVVRRSAYLLLLIENPDALRQLITLTQASPWIAEELARRPALLDELLDPRNLYHLPQKSELIDELRRTTLRIPTDDLEAQMDAIRYFRSAHALRVAACEVTGALPLMKVSDYLTWIAETLLDFVVAASWREMTERYGYPDGDERATPNFIVVGYGKLGGIELGHGSDLDLVFIHNASTTGETDGDKRGAKTLDNQTFYMRLGQKIIHLLTTRMASGALYEVDMRLRPSGNSGMLVTTLTAFTKYQQNDAWTWEHQALVRARPVAGDSELAAAFMRVREELLCSARDREKLLADVVNMRDKMRSHLGSDKDGDYTRDFHLKQDRGGIVDIEFMVQYAVLGWGHQNPGLTTYTDNIRILECLAQTGILSTQEVDDLTGAYKAFRSMGHKLTLQQKSSVIAVSELDEDIRIARDKVAKLWQKLMSTPPAGHRNND